MKVNATVSLSLVLLAGCMGEEPDFSDLSLRMPKADVLDDLGEPQKIEYLLESDSGENILVDEVPEEADRESVYEHWIYDGKRTHQITENRKYVEKGEITVIFGGRGRNPELVRGFWFRDQEYLEAEARANDT